jgi:hypothetical protein
MAGRQTKLRALPADAEVMMRGSMEPVLMRGAGTLKVLCADFLADFQDDWRANGKEIFPVVREKYPQVYFNGMIALARMIRWQDGVVGDVEKPRTPEEVLAKLEARAGPEGRKLFERFLRQLNKLQEEQRLAEIEAQQQDPNARK